MADRQETGEREGAVGEGQGGGFITIPARARDEIGELAFYIERMLQNLREVNDHVRGSSRTMPGVLHDLRSIIKMTEAATVKVLDETEALIEEGQAASALIVEARQGAVAGVVDRVSAPLAKIQALLDTAGSRAMAIMSALEFQDLTAQKVARAFEVLEEVAGRLVRIQALVDLGRDAGAGSDGAAPEEAGAPTPADDTAGQALADELLLQFKG